MSYGDQGFRLHALTLLSCKYQVTQCLRGCLSKSSTRTQRTILVSSRKQLMMLTTEPVKLPETRSVYPRHNLLYTCMRTHPRKRLLSFVSDSNALPVQSCLRYSAWSWEGSTPKVTAPGSDVSARQQAWNTGWLSLSLSLSPWPLPRSQLLRYTLPIFLFDRPLFPFLSVHLGETRQPKENQFGWGSGVGWWGSGGCVQETVGSSLRVSLKATSRANTQINTDNRTRKRIASVCCLLDKHCSVRHAG